MMPLSIIEETISSLILNYLIRTAETSLMHLEVLKELAVLLQSEIEDKDNTQDLLKLI
jgi:hypothetical protein